MKGSTKISLFALLVAIASFGRDCCYHNEINLLTERINSLEYQPKVHFINGLKINQVYIDPEKTSIKSRELKQSKSGEIYLAVSVNMDISIKYSIKVTNVGNKLAKIAGIFSAGPPTDENIPIELILSKADTITDFDPYFDYELLPDAGDTITITQNINVAISEEHNITIHLLLYYENELGNLYDSYFVAQYEVRDMVISNDGKMDIPLESHMVLRNQRQTTRIYSKKQKEKLRDRITAFEKE